MKTRKQKLEEIFYANASPEERLAYDLKKEKNKVFELENLPVEEKIVEVEKEVIKEVIKENQVTGEVIVQKINDLAIIPEKQIEFQHIKNFPWHLTKGNNDLISWGGEAVWNNGEGNRFNKLTVSATAPTDPRLHDLWVDIS